MRRDQFDITSQPVKNLAQNPRWEAGTGGSTIVRQNLCWNPSMLGSSGLAQVRINRSTNPRGILPMLHYSGAMAQTITPNIDITSMPIASEPTLETAIRFTYGPSASNPGLNIMSPVQASTSYTMSAWVYIESLTSQAGGGGFAENGVVSGSSINANLIGEWQKVSWTRMTTASPGPNFGIRFAAVGGTGIGSILVTGIVIEIGSAGGASPVFFDGSTPAGGGFTYRWTGTPNASVSEQNAPMVTSWSARWFGAGGGAGASYQSQGTGIGGSVSYRKLWKTDNTGNSNDSGISVAVPVTAGLTYTASIYQNASFDTNLAIFVSWRDSSDVQLSATSASLGIASPAGVWTRHSATAVAPTGAVSALFVFGPYNTPGPISSPATPAGNTIDWDNCLIEQTNALTPYFDANMADTGDFTYTWQGAVNGGISREAAPTPFLANSSGGAYRAAYLSTDRPAANGKFLRLVNNSNGIAVAVNPTDVVIDAGVTRTDLMWIRSSRNATINLRYRNPSGSSVQDAGSISLVANQWTLVRRVAAPTGAPDMALGPLIQSGVAGETLDLGPHMTVEGEYYGDIIDGEKPFSKWLGAADQSISVGYAPQLLDLASGLVFDETATGTYTLPGGWSSSEGRTIYTVFNNLVDIPDSNVPTLVTYGSTALNDSVPNSFITLRQQAFAGDVNSILARRTGGAGAFIGNVKSGVNVTVWGLNNSANLFITNNNGTLVTDAGGVMAVPHQKMYIGTPTAWGSHVRTIIYRGYHDATTRAAVSRYLGNKYGAPVA